jgi:hypothetical protein
MTMNTPRNLLNTRLEREVERERQERQQHDEQRAGLAADAEFRLKDARENMVSGNLKRSTWR